MDSALRRQFLRWLEHDLCYQEDMRESTVGLGWDVERAVWLLCNPFVGSVDSQASRNNP